MGNNNNMSNGNMNNMNNNNNMSNMNNMNNENINNNNNNMGNGSINNMNNNNNMNKNINNNMNGKKGPICQPQPEPYYNNKPSDPFAKYLNNSHVKRDFGPNKNQNQYNKMQ